MKRGIWIGLIAALAFAAIIVARLPASWVSGFLPKDVTCAEISGTLWRGSCSGLVAQGTSLGDLAWRLSAMPLLLGRVASSVDLQHPNGTATADVEVRPGGAIEARQVAADFQIDPRAMTQIPPDLRGRVHAQLARLRLEKGAISAIEGRIDLNDLERRSLEHPALGDYTLTFPATRAKSQGNDVVGDLDSRGGGPWQIQATLRLTRQPGFEIDGLIAMGPGAPADMVESLGLLGPPDAQGRRPFSVAGTF